tara:strand:+ start:317 stop:538 length:222 start_codon:yes stop_codon:yes gene_type:complete
MKHIIDTKTNKLLEVEETTKEISEKEIEIANDTTKLKAEVTAKAEHDALKASAKEKLIAGEPLTKEEADTIVL